MIILTPKIVRTTLISCPNCESEGKREVLAEIRGNQIEVLRFHKGSTKIIVNECIIICGACGQKVFYRVSPKPLVNG